MLLEGGCYCGAIRYKVEGDPIFKAQCHCRECQYISGGSPNVVMGFPIGNFSYTKGAGKPYARKDLKTPLTREFCAECGTHVITRLDNVPMPVPMVNIKVGTLDDPSVFGGPDLAIFLRDRQSFHLIPDDIRKFEGLPQ